MSRKEIKKDELDRLRDVLTKADARGMWTVMRQLKLGPLDVPYYIFFNGLANSHIGLGEGYFYDLVTIKSYVEMVNPSARDAMLHSSFEEFAESEQYLRQDQFEEAAATPNEVWRLCKQINVY